METLQTLTLTLEPEFDHQVLQEEGQTHFAQLLINKHTSSYYKKTKNNS